MEFPKSYEKILIIRLIEDNLIKIITKELKTSREEIKYNQKTKK